MFGWKWERKGELQAGEERPSVFFYAVAVIVLLGIFCAESDRVRVYSAYGAYFCVHTGEADNFYREYLDRLERLRNGEENPVFEPYNWMPELLYSEDLSEDRWAGQNKALASWYDKESVRMLPTDCASDL